MGAALIEPLEQAHDGFVTGCVTPVKQAHKRGIQAGDVSMGETGSATPDAHKHLLNELLWTVSPVGAGLGQLSALKGNSQPHAIDHAFQKGQSTPGGDLTRGELQIERRL
jgi:hypothetical protein